MSEPYKIELGIGLKDGDFNSIKDKIKTLENDDIKIKLDTSTVDTQIKNIKAQLQGLGNIGIDLGTDIKIDTNAATKSAQQVGQKIGTAVTKELKKNLNIDGVIEKETVSLMREYNISTKSKSGKIAKDEIKKALTGYVNEVKSGGKNIDSDIFGSVNTIDVALRKVTDAIAKNKKEVKELDILYKDMLKDIKSINNGKGAVKISLPDMRSAWGGDYKANKELLGAWFSEAYSGKAGSMGIDSWVKSKNWSSLLDLDTPHQNIASQLIERIKEATTVYSGDELFKEGFLNVNDVEERIKESALNISTAEQKMVQSSNASTDAIVQNYQKQQEAIKANLEAKKAEIEQEKKRLAEINKSIDDNNRQYNEATIAGDTDGISKSLAQMDALDARAKEQETKIKTLEASLKSAEQQAQETAKVFSSIQKGEFPKIFNPTNDDLGGMKNTAKSVEQYFKNLQGVIADTVSVKEQFDTNGNLDGFTVSLKNANGEAEKLRYAFQAAKEDGKAFFKYTGGSIDDNTVGKQSEKSVKTANDLQIELDKIKTGYSDTGATKPIKNASYIASLDEQYERVEKAIIDVRNADSSTFTSMVSNAKKEKAALESMVKVYRNADNVSNSLKGTDFASGVKIRIEELGKFKAQATDFPQMTKTIRELDKAIEGVGDKSSLDSFTDQLKVAKAELAKVKAETIATQRKEKVGIDVSDATSRIANIQRISPEIDDFKAEINGVEVTVESLLNDLSKVDTAGDFSVVNKKLNAFEKAAESAGIAVKELGKSASNSAITKEINQDINGFIKLQKQIENTRFEIGKLEITGGSTNQIEELQRELKELEDTYDKLMQAFMKKISVNADVIPFNDVVSKLDNGIAEATRSAENRLEQFKAKWADTRAELARGIKADIELGSFEDEIDTMRSKFNSLSDANDELRRSVEFVENAYKDMLKASKANTGDEVADRERLIEAEKKYAAALEKTNNLIKIQARADKKDTDKKRLADSKDALKLDMVNWLNKNTKAAREYGSEINKLIASLDKLDEVGVKGARRQFSNLTKEADSKGLSGLTVFGKLKSKAKEYMSYLSAAELFMYAEQALRSMFEQVKLIDSAMTELKKVTNETDASYNKFLSNAATRAKELGTTIDGLVSSTADFARLGYDFKEAQGLAEVANIYAVVGDDIEGVEGATESLISTMAAFKDEMNGMSDSDFAMRIIDSYNELGNKYAISSGGLGEALERSASSLAAANNSLHESAALITAANEVVQNPEKVGKWLCRLKKWLYRLNS